MSLEYRYHNAGMENMSTPLCSVIAPKTTLDLPHSNCQTTNQTKQPSSTKHPSSNEDTATAEDSRTNFLAVANPDTYEASISLKSQVCRSGFASGA